MKADHTVFVVDDEPVIVAILSHAGYAATAFEDPTLAVKAAAEMAPDLLITDARNEWSRTRDPLSNLSPEMQGALIFGTGRDCGPIDRRSTARLQIRPVR